MKCRALMKYLWILYIPEDVLTMRELVKLFLYLIHKSLYQKHKIYPNFSTLTNAYRSVLIIYRFHSYQEKHMSFPIIIMFLPILKYLITDSGAKDVRLKVCVRLWVNLPYLMYKCREYTLFI